MEKQLAPTYRVRWTSSLDRSQWLDLELLVVGTKTRFTAGQETCSAKIRKVVLIRMGRTQADGTDANQMYLGNAVEPPLEREWLVLATFASRRFSLINAAIAQSKGRSALLWWFASFFFGPICTLLLVICPPLRKKAAGRLA